MEEMDAPDNQCLFDNLLLFIGDKPVGNVTKKMLLSPKGD